MGKSNESQQPTNDQLLLLLKQQKQTREGSPAWYSYQQEINQIIAQNYLEYVNR